MKWEVVLLNLKKLPRSSGLRDERSELLGVQVNLVLFARLKDLIALTRKAVETVTMVYFVGEDSFDTIQVGRSEFKKAGEVYLEHPSLTLNPGLQKKLEDIAQQLGWD